MCVIKRHHLVCEQFFAHPKQDVFDFFAQPENLERITPPWLRFKMEKPGTVSMAVGLRLAYRIRLLGLPLTWVSRIAVYDPPNLFVDEQLVGPYKLWRHRHVFRAEGGGTVVRDDVEYEVGWGLLGAAAHGLYVKRSLNEIFNFRQNALKGILI